ncbi:hypothetical protein AYO38_02595 [bacterium SCGC AG-212-C10]|nr:hypothetical protein AYO38_02595 [bacterium SCGC AG-212-C10]
MNGSVELADATCVLRILSGLPCSATGFQIVFLDVGQGDSELISVGNERLLIDGGPSATVILDRLAALGVTDIDAIVATHEDADHVRGLTSVLNQFQVERIYVNGDAADTQTYAEFLSAAVAEPGATVITLTRGSAVPLGGLNLAVLGPSNLGSDDNNNSIVMQLTCQSVSVLLRATPKQERSNRSWELDS